MEERRGRGAIDPLYIGFISHSTGSIVGLLRSSLVSPSLPTVA